MLRGFFGRNGVRMDYGCERAATMQTPVARGVTMGEETDESREVDGYGGVRLRGGRGGEEGAGRRWPYASDVRRFFE